MAQFTDKKYQAELMRFSRKYGLKGTPLVEVEKIREDFNNGTIQLSPVKRGDKPQSQAKRMRDQYSGIRYLVKEVLNMPHILNTAYEKARDPLYMEYVYCKTDLTKKEIGMLFGLPVNALNKMIDKGRWKKQFPVEQISSEPKLITLIYKDAGEAIHVPDITELKDVDERYRQEFYKLFARIKRASNMSSPDTAYINGLSSAVSAMSTVYKMEREVNGKLSVEADRKLDIQDRMVTVQEKKINDDTGDVTVVQMPDNYNKDAQVLLYLLKETLGEKGLSAELKDDVLGSLVHKMTKLSGEDDEENIS